MKVLWTLLLALAFAMSPGALSSGRAAVLPKTTPCRHCSCGGVGCCVDEAPASSQPAPVAPVRTSVSSDDLALLFAVVKSLLPTDPRAPEVGAVVYLAPHLPAVALHTRYCCFLI